MSKNRSVNWSRLLQDRSTFLNFAYGDLSAHDFRNSSMEARYLIESVGNARKVRERCRRVAQRRGLVAPF